MQHALIECEQVSRPPAGVNTLAHNGTLLQVTTSQQSIQQNQEPAQLIYAMFALVSVIVALVGTLGLFNTLSSENCYATSKKEQEKI